MKLRGALSPHEEVLISTRSHPSFLLPALFLGLVAAGAASFGSAMMGSSQLFGWLGYALAAWCAWKVGKDLVRWVNTGFILTNYRLVIQRGIGRRKTVDLPLSWIEGVDARSTLTGQGATAHLHVHAQGRVYVLRSVPRGREFSQRIYRGQQWLSPTVYR